MTLLLILACGAIFIFGFFRFYPPFGGKTPLAKKQKSKNFMDGKFVNQIPTPMELDFKDSLSLLRGQFKRHPARKPAKTITPEKLDTAVVKQEQITWFGHSAFLLQMNGKNLLLDPMFGRSPSPIPVLGPQRFSKDLPAMPKDLPHIDAVVISHDHYDHLDYGSIKKIANKVDMFFVPLGLKAHLKRWGVKETQITEMDWWDETEFEGFTFVCTPSRHFSGRTLTDRSTTLWASWVISTDKTKIFFSGDSGYGPHFKQVGDKYGPFDLTLLECGQYDPHWSTIHMFPEQTAQAHQDLRGKRMIPMHWGAFVLSLHDWSEPVKRVLAAGAKDKAIIMTPKIGETVAFKAKNYPTEHWWVSYE